uniref:Uncharacterized protein n=1 Tax=Paracidobacterium acidisoli TaxID=2303751 RepID=A0A372ISD0_9BACT
MTKGRIWDDKGRIFIPMSEKTDMGHPISFRFSFAGAEAPVFCRVVLIGSVQREQTACSFGAGFHRKCRRLSVRERD